MSETQDTYISTVSGKRFYFNAPTRDMIDVQDIAHALGNLCRFTGQCREFYSVAEHSVLMSRLVPAHRALEALLHDATEAYCADLARPIKNTLPGYRAMEDRIWQAVAYKFDLPLQMSQEIKVWDMAMLKREVEVLLPPHCAVELNLPGHSADVNLHMWSPRHARFMFLQRYRELTS